VRGEVKIKTFTANPKSVVKYGDLVDESGERTYRVKVRGEARGLLIARIEGVDDRNAAEAIKGLRLYIDRDRLPKPKRNEWYLADLVGLRAERTDGTELGVVKTTMNYGAGDILEIALKDGQSLLLPFTKRVAPQVDVEQGRIVIEPPEEVEWKPETDEESASQ
jgi:16S rRNA processing protein RimM